MTDEELRAERDAEAADRKEQRAERKADREMQRQIAQEQADVQRSQIDMERARILAQQAIQAREVKQHCYQKAEQTLMQSGKTPSVDEVLTEARKLEEYLTPAGK